MSDWVVAYDGDRIDTSVIDAVVGYMESYVAWLHDARDQGRSVALHRSALEEIMRKAGTSLKDKDAYFLHLEEALERVPQEHLLRNKGRTMINDIGFIQQAVNNISELIAPNMVA